jgi:hypothetical protein
MIKKLSYFEKKYIFAILLSDTKGLPKVSPRLRMAKPYVTLTNAFAEMANKKIYAKTSGALPAEALAKDGEVAQLVRAHDS